VQNLYQIHDLQFEYDLGAEKVAALNRLNCVISRGMLVTISGPSGSGKSTLLNLLGLIEPLQKGKILFEGEDFQTMSPKRKDAVRKEKLGFIFQHFHLIPVLSAEENVAYFLHRQKLPKEEIKKRTEDALKAVGLWERRLQKPSQLSGGQKQRVAIARALAKNPQVIIGDEVTASLDQTTGREIMEIFKTLIREKGITVILTTHDPMVLAYADRSLHLQDGVLTK